MFKRHEFKYVLSTQQALVIENFIENKVGIPRDVMSNGDYSVTSLYFDTPHLTDFYEKLGGFKKRKKLRARIYGSWHDDKAQHLNLEIKEKHDMSIFKKKISTVASTVDIVNNFDSLLASIEDSEYLQQFKYMYYAGGYRPHIIVRYDRRAYEQQFRSKVRVTFDSNIETCYVNRGMTYSYMQKVTDKVILEVKFSDSLPWWFGYITKNFGLSREPYSKYSESVDLLTKLNPVPR